MGFDFNFIQDDSPPAQTLIAPSIYQKNKNEEDILSNYIESENLKRQQQENSYG